MTLLPAQHVISGPLDAFVELLLPILIVAFLWWWSARAERKRKDREKPR